MIHAICNHSTITVCLVYTSHLHNHFLSLWSSLCSVWNMNPVIYTHQEPRSIQICSCFHVSTSSFWCVNPSVPLELRWKPPPSQELWLGNCSPVYYHPVWPGVSRVFPTASTRTLVLWDKWFWKYGAETILTSQTVNSFSLTEDLQNVQLYWPFKQKKKVHQVWGFVHLKAFNLAV